MHVCGQQVVHVHDNLLAKRGSSCGTLNASAATAPLAGRIRADIATLGLRAVTDSDTAWACEVLAKNRGQGMATIAAKRAAVTHRLTSSTRRRSTARVIHSPSIVEGPTCQDAMTSTRS